MTLRPHQRTASILVPAKITFRCERLRLGLRWCIAGFIIPPILPETQRRAEPDRIPLFRSSDDHGQKGLAPPDAGAEVAQSSIWTHGQAAQHAERSRGRLDRNRVRCSLGT